MEDNKNQENFQNTEIKSEEVVNLTVKNEETENTQHQDELKKEETENSQQKEIKKEDVEVKEVEKKKSSAEILLEKLQQRKPTEKDSPEKVEELKKISKEVETNAVPDTIVEKEEAKTEKKDIPNYNDFSREQLVASIKNILDKPLEEIKEEVEIIKNTFYKKRNAEIIVKRDKFVEDGGLKEDFKIDPDEYDNQFKDLYDKYRDLKHQQKEQIQAEKKQNLENKYTIIKNIEDLINKDETLNKTFDEFHKYRDEWDKSGLVPQSESKTLFEKYNFTLQKFYDWVKINKELRDFDLKKNLSYKIILCEQTEALILEPKITKAYNTLQDYHAKWKATGPVPNDQREEIWERFKEASSIINKRHYSYFEDIKKQQEDNYKAKELLCEEAANIASQKCTSSKEWHQKTDEINELFKLWKLIGFVPKKNNKEIFDRFMSARKLFFDNKHEFFQSFIDELKENLQAKEQLIIEAENAKESTEWNRTTDFFIKLQNKWKKTGSVPNENRNEVWNRFNKACNYFFEKKRVHFENRKEEEKNNLKLKNEIIEKIKNLESQNDTSEDLKNIQILQKEWAEIGFVPFKEKDTIFKEYRDILDEQYKKFDISKAKRKELEIKTRYTKVVNSNQPYELRDEIEKVKNKIAEYKSEIITLENNLTFFVKSKNAEGILKNLNDKIDKLKEDKEQSDKLLISLVTALRKSDK